MSSSISRDLLTESFAELNPVLGHDLIEYVFEGKDYTFLSRLSKKDRAEIAVVEAIKRTEFYLHLDSIDRADDEVLTRWGRLLAATMPEKFTPPEHMPQSIWAILMDALSAFSRHHQRKPDIPFTTISISRVSALMALEGVHHDAIPFVLISKLVGHIHYRPNYRPMGLHAIPGMPELLVQHPLVLDQLLPTFQHSSVFEVIRLASSHPPLAEARAELIAAAGTRGDKELRTPALAVLRSMPSALQVTVLEEILESAPASFRDKVIAAIEQIPDIPAAIGVLERSLAKNKKGVEEIDRAIQRLAIYEMFGAPENIDVPPMVPLAEHPLDDAAVDSIRAALLGFRERQERLVATYKKAEEKRLAEFPGTYGGNSVEFHEKYVQEVDTTLNALPIVVEYLSGRTVHPGSEVLKALRYVHHRLEGFEPINRVRAAASPDKDPYWHSSGVGSEGAVDVRAIAEAMVRVGHTEHDTHTAIVRQSLSDLWSGPSFKPSQLVGYMAEHPHQFDIILGLEFGDVPGRWSSDNLRADVLPILETSPRLAARYLPVVTELAMGTTKTNRAAAQRVLEKHGLAERIAEESLRVGNVDIRTAAVLWVESLSGDWAIDALARQLDREQVASVRATLIAALERRGRNISVYLQPAVLEAEAIKGLAKALPKEMRWFPFADLPTAHYVDGTTVKPEVLRWWVILSFTMKDPAGAGLMPLYVRTLTPASAAELGRFILTTWLARDATKDDEAAMERVFAAAVRYSRIVGMLGLRDPEIDRETLIFFEIIGEEPRPGLTEGAIDALDHFEWQRMREAQKTPTATAHRGILSLAGQVPGPELAEIVRQYMKRKHLKRAQIEALLILLSLSEDPEPTQLIVATARRYRSAGIQKLAGTLVDEIAARNGWSADDLADRMIPTAGLDSSRTFELDYGPRSFVARFGTSLKLTLETAEGEPVKALPAPRKDDILASSAKTQLSANKKELTAVVTTQRRRLYDAMCFRREWSGAEWRERLVEHPIMGLLITGLVWHLDDVTARPDLAGIVRTVDGSEIDVASDARVSVAHPTTLGAAAINAWRAVPASFGLGFEQFGAMPVVLEGTESRRDDFEGKASESFRLRSRTKAREWDRGETGDDVNFDQYVKRFDAAGLEGVLTFSGSSLPETNIPIELGALTVRRRAQRGGGGEVKFSEVPPALLAELVADYLFFGAD